MLMKSDSLVQSSVTNLAGRVCSVIESDITWDTCDCADLGVRSEGTLWDLSSPRLVRLWFLLKSFSYSRRIIRIQSDLLRVIS